MASNFNEEEFLPEPDSTHSNRPDCGCLYCKFERFVYILDRIEAEQTQREWDQQQEQDSERE